jgi:poly-beta-1,6-N-acetyl-D-glucosamine N-deacetylase
MAVLINDVQEVGQGSFDMILYYHNVVPLTAPKGEFSTSITISSPAFETQMAWLSKYFHILPLEQYLKNQQQMSSAEMKRKKFVSITFDDGTASTYRSIVPILKKYQIPTTIFVSTCQLEQGPLIWGAYLNALCFNDDYQALVIKDREFPLLSDDQRRATRKTLYTEAVSSGDPTCFVREIAKKYPLSRTILDSYQGMTHDQLREAAAGELFEIGSHTVTHPYLSKIPDEMQWQELVESKQVLADVTGKNVRYFAYPSGDYNEQTLSILKIVGYDAAFATSPKNIGGEPRFEFPRTGIFSSSLIKLQIKMLMSSYHRRDSG